MILIVIDMPKPNARPTAEYLPVMLQPRWVVRAGFLRALRRLDMGELSEQILSGGPDLIPLGDLPEVAQVMNTPKTGWELYRAEEIIRARFFEAMDRDYHLHVWARFEKLSGEYGSYRIDLDEAGARELAGMIVGSWGVGERLGRAIADGIREYAGRLSPESRPDTKAAVAALVRLANRYAPR
jgi:hypothetical protein